MRGRLCARANSRMNVTIRDECVLLQRGLARLSSPQNYPNNRSAICTAFSAAPLRS